MNNFDWDKYADKATWNEMYACSPFFVGKRLPSMIKQEQVYLSSLDLDFLLSDTEGLLNILPEIKSSFERHVKDKDYYRAAMAQSDWHIVDNILDRESIGHGTSLDNA